MSRTRLSALALVATATAADAQADLVGVHLASAHARGGYAAATVGIYVRSDGGLTLGALRNSERRLSVYAGHTWTVDGRWALTLGAITGYRSASITPLLVPSLRVPLDGGVAARLSLIPKPRNGGSSALHLSFETRF